MSPALQWTTLTKKRGSSTQGIPPGKEDLAWVASTVTLIQGERDAVLVDTFLTSRHATELADWIAESGRNLVAIYVTHSHGDHHFGLRLLLERFPDARAVATAHVAAAIQHQIETHFLESFWEPRFPGQLPTALAAPEALDGDTLRLEGETLRVVELGHTDTSHSTAVHVPSVGLVVAGDCVYDETHPYLGECDADARNEWLRALDTISALDPDAAVAGHGVPDADHSPRHIEETRRYIRDFDASVAVTSTPLELYERMLALYPDRANPGSLWGAARAAKP